MRADRRRYNPVCLQRHPPAGNGLRPSFGRLKSLRCCLMFLFLWKSDEGASPKPDTVLSRVRSARDRTWDDVPWASHPVTLIYAQRRVRCRHGGIRTDAIEFADPKARVTRCCRTSITS